MAYLGDVFILDRQKVGFVGLDINVGKGTPADGNLLKIPKNVIISSGTVNGSIPANRKLILVDDKSFCFVAQGITDSNGSITFFDVAPGVYKLIVDGTSWSGGDGLNYQSVVYDRIIVS